MKVYKSKGIKVRSTANRRNRTAKGGRSSNTTSSSPAKLRYQKKYNARPDQKKYRAQLNKAGRDRKVYGKRHAMKKDMSHAADGSMRLQSRRKNRAANGRGGRSRYSR